MGQQQGGEGAVETARPVPAGLVAGVLRSVAQVDLMPSAVCGLLFVAALFAAGPQYGLYGLLGSAVSTAVAYGLGLDRRAVAAGLHGYNGCLVAVGCAVHLGAGHPATAAVAVLGSAVAVVVTAGLGAVLSTWRLSALTAPFCLVATAVCAPFGGHAFTWPFVLTTMLFLAAVPAVPRLCRV